MQGKGETRTAGSLKALDLVVKLQFPLVTLDEI